METCNYCLYKGVKARAKLEGKRVIKRQSKFGRGVNIYKIDMWEKVPDTIIETCDSHPKGDDFHEKHFTAWFMCLPTSCAC